mmetsp:Transcript_20378/g.28630  ORF Transcript_20378/g.28630 Transcript_20378/m.28630 type:complete len:158 (+) Transcript_20378:668-1141(+)
MHFYQPILFGALYISMSFWHNQSNIGNGGREGDLIYEHLNWKNPSTKFLVARALFLWIPLFHLTIWVLNQIGLILRIHVVLPISECLHSTLCCCEPRDPQNFDEEFTLAYLRNGSNEHTFYDENGRRSSGNYGSIWGDLSDDRDNKGTLGNASGFQI